jgi:3-hydroxybutyryl-CoA dehydrogenase
MSDFSHLGIVGAGFMGSGIAESAARAGLAVSLFEPDRAPLERSRAGIEASLQKAVGRGKVSAQDAADQLGRIAWVTDMDALGSSDVVVEAVTEDLQVKQDAFRRLDALLAPEALLASNTSSIPIAQLAGVTERPDRVLGLHFFSPVPVMRLVEVVAGLDTSPDTVARASALAGRLGKTPIQTKDRSGFVVNFLLIPYLMAAVRMYEDGFAAREDIDQGMVLGCGHPMGPLALCDFIGLDVVQAIAESLFEEFRAAQYAPPPLVKRMVAAGRLGRKAGRGFYEYAP